MLLASAVLGSKKLSLMSPGGTLTQLQGSDSRPLARRSRRWTRREKEDRCIVSLEQETQLRVLEVTAESLYTVQNSDIILDVIMTSQRRHRISLPLGLSTQAPDAIKAALLRTPEPNSYNDVMPTYLPTS